MNNNILLGFIVSILPRLTLFFVGLVLLYKIYFKIRSKYSATVNCWFCNENSKVPYLESNSWTCTKCEQYNGFSKDGGYNREIIQQFDCSNSIVHSATDNLNNSYWRDSTIGSNGFCDACNEAQRLKVEKLAQFEPKRESRFDEELKIYKAQLEEQYRLCGTCDRHLTSVLRDKKKMVLGSKFLEYIIKGAEAIKQPHYNFLRQAKQELWKQRLSLLITMLTLINLFCLFGSLPELNRAWFTDTFGAFGKQLFIACSHIVALWRVLTSLISRLTQNDLVIRVGLFTRTIFMMLLYSLGLRLPHLVRLNFLSLYLLAAPFCILASTFSYNVIDRFRISRFTLLLVLWSVYSGGLIEHSLVPIQQGLMFLTSMCTCFLTFTNKFHNSPKLYDDTASSFHKIYADDYLSDGDTATSSVLSQQLDCSSVSARSNLSRSFGRINRSLRSCEKKSPLTSSTFSLNLAARPFQHPYEKTSPLSSSMLSLNLTTQAAQEPTLNSSFKSCYGTDNNSTLRNRFGNSIYSFAAPARNPFIDATTNLNCSNNDPGNTSFVNASLTELVSNQQSKTHGHRTDFGTPAPSLRSAFAASSSALQNPTRPSRLLSPTRFTFNNITPCSMNTAKSFTHHDSFNQYKQAGVMSDSQSRNLLFDRNNGLGVMCAINEDLSRASSRSSGFESQSGHINNSRENSCCAETNEFFNRTSLLDNSRQHQTVDGYAPNGLNSTLTEQRPLMSPFSVCTQPISVNCNSEWYTSNRSNSMSRNSFNLRRFSQDLPNFKRGDLLKRWKEGEVMS